MNNVNILHLSDMHFGIVPDEEHTTSAIQHRDYLLSKLREKLKEISSTNLKPDVIVVTGDIGYRGEKSDYILASKWFGALFEDINIPWERLIVCPGNHDMARHILPDSYDIKNSKDAKEQLVIESVHKRCAPFYEYIQFCKNNNICSYKNSSLDPNNEVKYLYGYREYGNICFVVWNTAWNCKGKDIGTLYIGEPLVLDMKSIIPKNKTVISIMHHPFAWLNDEELYSYNLDPIVVDGIVAMSNIVMNGHVHGKIKEATCYQNKSYIFTSGAIYDKNNYHLGCQLIQLDLDRYTYSTKLFEYDNANDDWILSPLENNIPLLSKEKKSINPVLNDLDSKYNSCGVTNDISIGTKNTVKHFIGRASDLRKIKRIIHKEKQNHQKVSLWIYCMGGMGKTQLCRKLYWDFHNQTCYIAWVTCNGDFKTSLVNSFVLKSSGDNLDESYKKIISTINEKGEDLILFVDNFDPKDKCLKDIESLKCNVVISSRYKNPDTFSGYMLGPIPFKFCKSLFKKFYKIEDNIYMNEIIHKTGYLTLAIELLAKTGQKNGWKLEQLYNKLEEKEFDIKTVINSNWDNCGERLNDEISKHFEKVFDLSIYNDDKQAMYILKNMSLFPYLSIEQYKIIDWLGLDEENNLLADLYDSGWLQCFGFEYVMHPVISYTIRKYHKPAFDECMCFVSSISQQIQITSSVPYLNSLIYLPFATSAGTYFKNPTFWNQKSSELLALLFVRISEVYRYNGEYRNACNWAHLADQSWNNSLKNNGSLINNIYNTLSEVYLDMRDSDEKCAFWAQRAIEEDKLHPDVDNIGRSTSYHNLASAYIQMGDIPNALTQQLNAVKIRELEANTKESKIRLANSYRNLAMIYRRLPDIDKAYHYITKVIDILNESYSPDCYHPDMSVAYNILSFVFRDKGKKEPKNKTYIKQAIKYQLRATEIRERINKNDPKLAINYNNLGIFYLQDNNPHEAKEWMEKAIAVDLKNRHIQHPDLAGDYYNYSKVLIALGDTTNAIYYLNESKKIEETNKNSYNVAEINELLIQLNNKDNK